MIHRIIESEIKAALHKGRAIVVYGSRQTGKTTLVKKIAAEYKDDSLYLNCDEPHVIEKLKNKNSYELYEAVQRKKIVIIDEAQRVENIGLTIKLLVDNYPDVQVIATGSSSFDLANRIKEPLTGRATVFTLFPLSFRELQNDQPDVDSELIIKRMLRFGGYPKVWSSTDDDAARYLSELTSDFLYKDLLMFELLRQAPLVMQLLRALALQVGNEVSYSELAKLLFVDNKTVERYIFLLEQVFIVFRLQPYYNRPRKEIGRLRKVYFYDLGVLNSLVQNYNSMEVRTDVGAVWENFCVLERLKMNSYERNFALGYFWREGTGGSGEVDYVEVLDSRVHAYEFKWNSERSAKIPKRFAEYYPEAGFTIINPKTVARGFLT
jgi:uncharacterized protein